MTNKIVMYGLLFPAMFLSISHLATGQEAPARSYEENARIDSLASVYNHQEEVKDEERRNSENLSDLKAEKKDTKAKAREAQRVEDDANAAARESKIAYRQEKKAQRAREQADKQSRKAAKARRISNQN